MSLIARLCAFVSLCVFSGFYNTEMYYFAGLAKSLSRPICAARAQFCMTWK
jgi:hypothetical protein